MEWTRRRVEVIKAGKLGKHAGKRRLQEKDEDKWTKIQMREMGRM